MIAVAEILASDFLYVAAQDIATFVNQRDIVADFFYRRHVVGGENHRRPIVFEFDDFIFKQLGVNWVETGEGFVENQKLGTVEHRDYKLHLLSHAF